MGVVDEQWWDDEDEAHAARAYRAHRLCRGGLRVLPWGGGAGVVGVLLAERDRIGAAARRLIPSPAPVPPVLRAPVAQHEFPVAAPRWAWVPRIAGLPLRVEVGGAALVVVLLLLPGNRFGRALTIGVVAICATLAWHVAAPMFRAAAAGWASAGGG